MTLPPDRTEWQLLPQDLSVFRAAIGDAVGQGALTAAAARHLEHWLQLPLEPPQSDALREHLRDRRWADLEQAFWQVLPFGTAGRRGRMYPIGTATINERTIGESVQALAVYLRRLHGEANELRAAVAFDCRHKSREFAELSAEILWAAGFRLWMLSQMRGTPELAQTVRHYGCHCGIMITASHNPPSDNAIKVFWSTGGQLLPPHDQNITREQELVRTIHRQPLRVARREHRVIFCEDQMDRHYQQAVLSQGFAGHRDVRVLYSPLHGVGLTSIPPILRQDGFHDVHIFAPHAMPDPDFPNVPGNIANPEQPAVMETLVAEGQRLRADLALASDPDADRIGCTAPVQPGASSWQTFSGNQIAALIAEYVLRQRQAMGSLSPELYVIRTIVSSAMVDAIADVFGVRVINQVLTGFKWIGDVMDREGPERFVFGFEEAHGYLVGSHIRDKDAGVAALLLTQRAAESKAAGRTLAQDLDQLFRQFGCFQELSVARQMPGALGMSQMQEIMQRLRTRPPTSLGRMPVVAVQDYLTAPSFAAVEGSTEGPSCPAADLLVLQLEQRGFRVAIRPSGTEPKIKFYLFAMEPASRSISEPALEEIKQTLRERLWLMFDDLMKSCGLAIEVASHRA